MKKWGMTGLAVVTAGAVVFGALGVAGIAQAQTPPGPGGGGQNRDLRRGGFDQLFQQLGVTAEQWRNASVDVRNQIIEQAVVAGRITREMGDRLKTMGARRGNVGPGNNQGGPNRGPGGNNSNSNRGPGGFGFGSMDIYETLAGSMGMTEAQLRAELRTKSIADVAREHGRTVDQIKNTIKLQMQADIQAAVAAGRMSQQNANRILQGIDRMLDGMVNFKPGQFTPRSGSNQGPQTPRGPQAPQFAPGGR